MSESLLRSLRETLLDESEPLAGLLRKCLLLGAETGSDELREWARHELVGYSDVDQLPDYRSFDSPPISIDSQSGSAWVQGQVITRLQVPSEAREYIPEEFHFMQPVEELERLAAKDSLSFTSPGLGVATSIWNRKLPMFQNIIGMHYVLSGSTVSGVLGQIRTRLMEVVADLTMSTPLTELPAKSHVDEAVVSRLKSDTYNTTIHTASGAVAVGRGSHAQADTGLTVAEALRLLEEVSAAASNLSSDKQETLEGLVDEVRTELQTVGSSTGEVVKKAGRLRDFGTKLGVAAVSSAIASATKAVTELALKGSFS